MSGDDRHGLLKAQRAVFQSALRTNEKIVLLALLDRWSEKSPRPYPSAETLAADTSLHRASVLRAIEGLEAAGALSVDRAKRKNRYDLSATFAGLPTSRGERLVTESDQSLRATGNRERPVAEGDLTSRTERPVPVAESDPKEPREGTQEGTQVARGRAGARKRAAPIPPDWVPTEKHRAFALEHGLDLQLEVMAFQGHFEGQPVKSPNGRFSTWLANAVKFAQRDATTGRTAQPGPARLPATKSELTEGDWRAHG